MKYNKFKIYLAICVLIFFILTFVILFYSFGYRYNPQQGKIIQTGAIIVKTFPKNAKVSINGSAVKKNSGLVNLFNDFIKIESLEPGQYSIGASLEGFSNWEKNISIESEHVLEFKNIVLVKSDPEKNIVSQKIESGETKNLWISSGKNKIAYRKIHDGKDGLYIYDLPGKTERFLYGFEEMFPIKNSNNISVNNIIWSENDSRMFISIAKDKKTYSAVIIIEDRGKIYRTADGMEHARNGWDFQLNDSLFHLKDNALLKSEFAGTKVSTSRILEQISAFLAEGNTVYYIKKGGSYLYKSNMGQPASEITIAKLPDGFETAELSSITKEADSYLIITEQNKLYLIDDGSEAINVSSNATDASFFNNSSRIIYNNNNEIWIYYIREKNYQPQKQKNTNELLTRYSSNIGNIFLYGDDEHIFYKEGYVFKFAELDDRGKRNIFDVVSVKTNDVAYLAGDNSVVYLENGNLIRSFLDDEKR